MRSCSPTVCSSLTIALLVSSCGQQPGAVRYDRDAARNVTITVGIPEVRSAGTSIDATIPVVLTNAGPDPVFFNACGTTLERSVSGDWLRVFALMCSADTRARDVQVGAGEQRTIAFPVRATLGAGSDSAWEPPLDGDYRLMTFLRSSRELFPASARVTPSFRLVRQ